MIITFQYRIKPTPEQVAIMETWSELLRRHWNFAWSQRLDWLNRTRCQIDRCSIVSEPVGKIPERVDYYWQQSALKETKKLFPDYANIYSEVQQMNLQRLDKAWKRWLVPNKAGNRGGRPKFKKRGEKPSFSFSRVNHPKAACFLEGNILRIPKIGSIPAVVHRPIPEGVTLKTATICFKADGYYVSIAAEDAAVPTPRPLDEVKSAVGIDLGLKEFLATSKGEFVAVPQIYRKAHRHLARQHRELAKKKDGSKNRAKAKTHVAKIHQRIARQREMFHYQVAHCLCRNYDLIAVEALNIKGLARTQLVSLKGMDQASAASGNIVLTPGEPKAVLILRNLPVLPTGQFYQLWSVVNGEKIPWEQFNANNKGAVFVKLSLPSNFEMTDLVVTVEVLSAPKGPAGPMVMSSNL
jgi:putative transposase